jgi:riboflavin synthase alpha subunit
LWQMTAGIAVILNMKQKSNNYTKKFIQNLLKPSVVIDKRGSLSFNGFSLITIENVTPK